MQQKAYSRQEQFLSREKPQLRALPTTEFHIKYYAQLRVAPNNCIYLGRDKHYYSVPYTHIGEAVLITGSAGCGKSFLASALGNRACRQGYNVAYFNMQKLLMKLKVCRLEGTITKFFDKLAKTDLLIMDDFGLTPLQGQQQMDFMEIIEDRHAKKATIIASQLPVAKWFDVIGEETIADAILDRIVHTSHRFTLTGDTLRKKL